MGWLSILQVLTKSKDLAASNWKEILIILLLGAIWYQNTFEKRFVFFIDTIPYLEKQLAESKKDLKQSQNDLLTCKNGNDKLAASIEERNKEILNWKAASDKIEGERRLIKSQIDYIRTKAAQQVQDILNSEAPKSCKDAMQYLRNGRKELSWPK